MKVDVGCSRNNLPGGAGLGEVTLPGVDFVHAIEARRRLPYEAAFMAQSIDSAKLGRGRSNADQKAPQTDPEDLM